MSQILNPNSLDAYDYELPPELIANFPTLPKEDAKKYKESIAKTTETVRKKLTFEELDELKKGVNDVTSGITDGLNDVKKSVEAVKNPGEAVKNAVLGDNEKKEV